MVLLFPEEGVITLSKAAVSKKLKGVTWHLFRGVYNHLLNRYQKILEQEEVAFLSQFKKAFAIDGSAIAVSKQLEQVLPSINRRLAAQILGTVRCKIGSSVNALPAPNAVHAIG